MFEKSLNKLLGTLTAGVLALNINCEREPLSESMESIDAYFLGAGIKSQEIVGDKIKVNFEAYARCRGNIDIDVLSLDLLVQSNSKTPYSELTPTRHSLERQEEEPEKMITNEFIYEFSLDYDLTDKTEQTVKLILDPNNEIDEINENNNELIINDDLLDDFKNIREKVLISDIYKISQERTAEGYSVVIGIDLTNSSNYNLEGKLEVETESIFEDEVVLDNLTLLADSTLNKEIQVNYLMIELEGGGDYAGMDRRYIDAELTYWDPFGDKFIRTGEWGEIMVGEPHLTGEYNIEIEEVEDCVWDCFRDLEVTIKDEEGKTPFFSEAIDIRGSHNGYIDFEILSLPNKTYTITISKPGYEKVELLSEAPGLNQDRYNFNAEIDRLEKSSE